MGRPFYLFWLVSLCANSVNANLCQNSPSYTSFPTAPSIPNSQSLNGSSFIGSAVNAKPSKRKFTFYPQASLMHADGGNTGETDYPGPLGVNPNVSSATNTINIMIWGQDGSLSAGYANASAGSPPPRGVVALEPTTFQILAAWYPPANETLGLAYMEYIQETNDILLSTKEGHIYVVHRDSCDGNPYFTTIRTIDLVGIVQPWESLLNTMYDTAGNIWFTTGGIIGGGDVAQNSTTFGYITPRGTIVKGQVQDQMVENGIAVSGMSVYMATGPSGAANTSNATGYMWAMEATQSGELKVTWKVPYSAGAGGKPGEVARGTGATPVLLNDQFVVITDNADPQISLNVYHQQARGSEERQLVCQVPLFHPGASNNDNAPVAHFDGETYGVMIQNNYNAPPVFISTPGVNFTVNGAWNDMSQMVGGMSRVDVTPDGNCKLRWTSDLAIKAVSILSTKTGLLYSYVQDTKLAPTGQYIWYLAASDWTTGETVFMARTGAGGTFNDNLSEGTLGSDGMYYQAVLSGIVGVKDGK